MPKPGKDSWITELSGDWSINIESTKYDIGCPLDNSNYFRLYSWERVDSNVNKYYINSVFNDIISYSAQNDFVLLKRSKTFSFLNIKTDKITTFVNLLEFEEKHPNQLYLADKLKVPQPSMRNKTLFLGLFLTVIFFAKFCLDFVKKNKTQYVVYRKCKG